MNQSNYLIGDSSVGERLDTFLAKQKPSFSRSRIQQLIKDGHVLVCDKQSKPGYTMRLGDTIVLEEPAMQPAAITPRDIPLSILYEDDDILVVDKPKGMVVHPACGHIDDTLVNAILYHCKGQLSGINGIERPGIVHRIDRDTTGALIVCKNDQAHACIAKQLASHSITRRYRGIVCGRIDEDDGTINASIGRDPKNRKRMAVNTPTGKPAVTHYRVLERFTSYTYAEFWLETGRTHQIRVHMRSIGHPLLGDTLYGSAKCPFKLEGQTLHAQTIGFIHPSTGKYMEWTAPLPSYFEELLRKLPR